MQSNRLAQEQSPYLLQHAHNPVDWHPWGSEAFEKARREDKPIFLSIGYSTCHWCHVMERESFENEEIAAILNRHFVSIKVDREERPDVDRIYMTFVQATTGSGGWPMSVWLTPDLKPFFGGTYFPPENRWGRAGFPMILERLAEAWRSEREKILESSEDVVRQLREHIEVRPATAPPLDARSLESGFFVFRRSFDTQLGGFGQEPKFPRPSVHNFLLRYWARSGNQEARDMVLRTLHAMARGGMNDQLGGGFHRYSVDARWFVPHFEKMLYDQAQLAISYLEAFQIAGDALYAAEARRIFDYVLRDMTAPDGGFYSAEDADSVIDPARPQEKGEGAFYIWTQREIEEALGSPAAAWFNFRYGVEPGGNVGNDPHEEFKGRNILYQAHSPEETAAHFGQSAETVRKVLDEGERKLLEMRSHRPRPHLDDKVLTAWNGLMISAFALGGWLLEDGRYLAAARRAAGFIQSRMFDGTRLLRRYRGGDAAIPGFLDDYAFFTQGLLDLYEAAFDPRDLALALRLAERIIELFEDREHGGFYSTAEGDPALVMRVKDDYDGAEPSGNSVAALNLLRLAEITGRADLRRSAERTLEAFAPRIAAAPSGVPQMMAALDFSLGPPRHIVIAGDPAAADTGALLGVLRGRFLPRKVVLLVSPETRGALAPMAPSAAGLAAAPERAAAYVCENYACRLPVHDPGKFAELLQ